MRRRWPVAGRGYLHLIERWQTAGYHVKIIFLKLHSADEAIARVANRVRQGGHDIPEATIRRRFVVGWKNFETLYAPRADGWVLYDNSAAAPLLLNSRDNK